MPMKKLLGWGIAAVAFGVAIGAGVFITDRRSVPMTSFEDVWQRQSNGSTQTEVAGVMVNFKDEGSGPVLVLLHGSFGSMRMFDAMVDQLKSRYRLVRYDQPPTGLSGPVPSDFSMTSEDFLAAVLDKLGVGSAALLATSSGGIIAYRFAAAYPQRVNALVLSNIPPSAPVDNAAAFARLPIHLRWSLSVCLKSGRPWPKACWRDFLDSNYWRKDRVTDELVTQYYDLNRRPGMMEFSSMTAIMRDDSEVQRLLSAVTAPTLLIWGMHDPVLPPATLQLLAERLTSARVEIRELDDVSHYPPMEAPEDVGQATEQFLENVLGSSAR